MRVRKAKQHDSRQGELQLNVREEATPSKPTPEVDYVGPEFFMKGGGMERITRADYEKLRATFPHLDVMAKLHTLALWTEYNPGKRKTRLMAFILNCFSHDKASRAAKPGITKREDAQFTRSNFDGDF